MHGCVFVAVAEEEVEDAVELPLLVLVEPLPPDSIIRDPVDEDVLVVLAEPVALPLTLEVLLAVPLVVVKELYEYEELVS